MRNETTADGVLGFDDVGEGQAVALLHAFPLSRAMWGLQVEALQTAYRVLTPDFRGFGDSGAFTGTPSIDQMADDVARILDEASVDRAVVGGLSMGGYVSLAFARRHAARLRGLILADTKAEPDDAAARANRDRMVAFAKENTGAAVIEQLMPKLLAPATLTGHPEIVEEVREIGAAQVSSGIVTALEAMRDRPDARPGLAAIRVPTLVLVGSDDTATPLANSETLAAAIPGSRLEVLPGAGHLSNLEQPAAFNRAVRAFLDSVR
jgi:pimeloyl-ACP methyl ester carboxylesterase